MTNTEKEDLYRKQLINDIFAIINQYHLPYVEFNMYTAPIEQLEQEHKRHYEIFKQKFNEMFLDK